MTLPLSPLSWTLLVLGLLAGAWTLGAWRLYRLREAPGRHLRVRTADGWEVAVFQRPPRVRRFAEPVVLAHGLGVTHRFMDFEPRWSLAHALNDAGFETWAVDFRGTGRSGRWGKGHGVDEHIHLDVPAVLEAVRRESGAAQVLWVGHSLGGLIGLAAAGGPAAGQLKGLVALGSPLFMGSHPVLARALLLGLLLSWPFRLRLSWVTLAAAPVVGRWVLPMADVVMNPAHVPPPVQRLLSAEVLSSISHGVLRQLSDWFASGQFRSRDGAVDYRAQALRLDLPLLFCAGTVDHLAPAEGVVRAFEASASSDKSLRVFGCAHGHAMDYGHGDLCFGTGAPTELFPVVRQWLEARATTVKQ
ncbi:MAG: alpha/beta fold hydrolase [Deltaproteobacteria bacterium]|nr:alpha/beta fold hydrolase [Deltaproteobacteria bacterium]